MRNSLFSADMDLQKCGRKSEYFFKEKQKRKKTDDKRILCKFTLMLDFTNGQRITSNEWCPHFLLTCGALRAESERSKLSTIVTHAEMQKRLSSLQKLDLCKACAKFNAAIRSKQKTQFLVRTEIRLLPLNI